MITRITHLPGVVILLLLFCSAGCDHKDSQSKPAITGITCRFEEGELLYHDFYFTNASGQELTEVRVRVKVTGVSGQPEGDDQYYSVWRLGEEKKDGGWGLDDRNRKIQKIELTGTCQQGTIDLSWVPKGD